MRILSITIIVLLSFITLSCGKKAVASKAESPSIALSVSNITLSDLLLHLHNHINEEFTLRGYLHKEGICPAESYISSGKEKYKHSFEQEGRCIPICSDQEIEVSENTLTEITFKVVKNKKGKVYFEISEKRKANY